MDSGLLVKTLKDSGAKMTDESVFCTLDYDLNLNRNISFTVAGGCYVINWYSNLMTLRCIGGLNVMFDNVVHSSTWPNEYKRNLQFYYGKNCVAVIGLELY